MTSYPQLRDVSVLASDDISNLSRQLHTRYRLDRLTPQILPHLNTLIADLRSGSVPGHPLASVHILSCLKEMEEFDTANTFWEWLITQSDEHTDARVYGAAIENLAYQGESLKPLEALYTDAISRYSSSVIPAVARDTGKNTRLMLFQGIITARLLHGEWAAAYEGFDVCVRLYPTLTPPRLYELIIYERPIMEGYIVFLMACRAGSPPKSLVLTPLLKGLWSETRDIKAMVRVVYAFAGAGGKPSFQHLNTLIGAILSSIGTAPKPVGHDDISVTAMNLIRDLIGAFGRVGVPPSLSTFNTIISLAGKLGRVDLVYSCLRELSTAGLNPNMVTYRIILNTFGQLFDPQAVRRAWADLCSEKKLRAEAWDLKDVRALVRACIRTNQTDFCRAELHRLQVPLGHTLYRNALDSITNEERRIRGAGTEPNVSGTTLSPSVKREIAKLTRIFSAHQIHNFATAGTYVEGVVDIDSVAPTFADIPQTELQKFYDTLTRSVSKVEIGEDPLQRTSTGYSVSQLRFENWRSVNRLLYEAELHEQEAEEQILGMAKREARGVIEEEGKDEVKKFFGNEERAKERIAAIKRGMEGAKREREGGMGRSEELKVRGRMGGELGAKTVVEGSVVP